MPRRPTDWDAQDWIVVAHALLRTRWHEDVDDDRALELALGVADDCGLPLSELLFQDEVRRR